MKIASQNRNQQMMFISLETMVSEDSEVRYLDKIVDEILSINPGAYKYKGEHNTGRPAYSVETLFKLYLYGYLERVPSCRALEKECNRNIELMWLLGNLRPDFKTIADFRKDNPGMIAEFTKSFKLYLKGKGLISGSSVSLDGTKLKANASTDKVISKTRLLKELEQIQEQISEYISNLSEGLSESELTELRASEASLKQQLSVMSDMGVNHFVPTDPESRMMKSHGAYIAGYNGQVAVENTHHFIVYEEIINEQNDINHLPIMAQEVMESLSIDLEEILADSGYCNLDEVEKLVSQGIECYTPKQSQPIQGGIELTYSAGEDCYYCEAGKRLVKKRKNKRYKNSYIDVYVGEDCRNCPKNINQECTKSKRGRNKIRYHNQEWRDKYIKETMKIKFKEKMKQRMSSIEHIFGTLKIWMGKLQFKLRGIEGVRSELKLWCTAYNIKKYIKMLKNMPKSALDLLKKVFLTVLCYIAVHTNIENDIRKSTFFFAN